MVGKKTVKEVCSSGLSLFWSRKLLRRVKNPLQFLAQEMLIVC